MSQAFFNMNSAVVILIAVIPSLVAWIRLGPRVDRLEKDAALDSAALLIKRAAQDAESQKMQDVLTRLTTLQEVAERRLERLEDKK